MAFDINRLLKKRGWTGEETGKALIFSLINDYKQTLAGSTDPKPLFPSERIREMLHGFRASASDIEDYNRYIELQNWIKQYQAVANAYFQRFQSSINEFIAVVRAAETAESEYRYIERLPRIVTQKQYDALKAKRIEETLDPDGDGTDAIGDNLLCLIFRAVSYYALQLEREPKRANPLKAIKKRYQKQPETNPAIIAVWNRENSEGYYQLPDGTRSDEVSKEEWEKRLLHFSPDMQRLIAEGQEGLTGLPGTLSYERLTKEARAAHMGEEPPQGGKSAATWHTYEEAPEGLTKWDIIEADARGNVLLFEYYPSTVSDAATPEEYIADANAFKKEFPELVEAVFKALDAMGYTYGEEDRPLSAIPVEEWGTTVISWRELYNASFPGFREWVESDINIFNGDKRAILNGIAILRASDLLQGLETDRRSLAIDEEGNYIEPDGGTAYSALFGLEKYTPANPESGDDIDYIERNREALKDSLRWLIGYDTALQLIAEEIGIADFTIFSVDIERCLTRTKAVNSMFDMLYQQIDAIDYADKEKKAAKLEALRDVFYPLKTDELAISEGRRKQAAKMLEGLEAFSTKKGGHAPGFDFLALLTKPEGGGAE